MTATVSIVRTASRLPDEVVSNREIGERLVVGVEPDDEAVESIVAKVRERSGVRACPPHMRNRSEVIQPITFVCQTAKAKFKNLNTQIRDVAI